MPELTDEEKVQLARVDFGFYLGWAHKTDMEGISEGHMVPQPHHIRMIERMEDVAQIVLRMEGWKDAGPERHTAIVAPPGAAKTYILQGFYEWLLGLASLYWGENWADMFHIGHVSYAAKTSWRMSYAVRETVKGNDVFKMCFPKVIPSDKWSAEEWRVEGCIGLDPTFAALGIDGSIPSYRWNIMGLDDLIKPVAVRESRITPADVESIIFTVREVGMRRLVEGGCSVLTNTRWFERDPTSWALDSGWTHILIKALDEDDKSFWEDRQIFTAKTLIAERESNPEGFALQFQGEPAPQTGIDFKREWLSHTYDRLPWENAEEKANYFFIVDCWDTASTTNPRSDESAGWKAAVDLRTWQISILNLYHEKLESPDVLTAIEGSITADPFLAPSFVWIEDKSSGTNAWQTLSRKYGRYVMGVQPYGERGSGGKLAFVIKKVQIMLAAGQVKFPTPEFAMGRNVGWLSDAMTALLGYPRLVHDDIPRAFIMLLFEILKLQDELGSIDVQPKALDWGEPEGQRALA